MAKASVRETLKAEKEADAIMHSLSRASESAVATTLAAITECLKQNTPLMYHIHALLKNDDWRAVLEASAKGQATAEGGSGDKPDQGRKLRANVKKFEHLTRQLRVNVGSREGCPITP